MFSVQLQYDFVIFVLQIFVEVAHVAFFMFISLICRTLMFNNTLCTPTGNLVAVPLDPKKRTFIKLHQDVFFLCQILQSKDRFALHIFSLTWHACAKVNTLHKSKSDAFHILTAESFNLIFF